MTRPFTPIKMLGTGEVRIVKGQIAAQADAHSQDLGESEPFAPLRQNNEVTCFTTGQQYFKELSKKLKAAKKSIFIAGWQINWDVALTPEVDSERLIDILHDRIQSSESFRIFVMPWMSPKVGVNTNDLDTMLAIFQLNAGRKTMQAMCCPTGPQSDYVGTEGAAFSHHQKIIVIDNEWAYVGGIDLAYGRYDDNKFSLNAGAFRHLNERYNPGVTGSEPITPRDGDCLSTMDLLLTTLTAGSWNVGGNSEPGALSKFIESLTPNADALALDALEFVNLAAKAGLDAANAVNARVHSTASTGADVAVAAAKALSTQCAALQVPDLYGMAKSQSVGENPTWRIPEALRERETAARKDLNAGIEHMANLAAFMAPLKRLRVQTTPQSSLPASLEEAERQSRKGINVMINSAAAVGGAAQQVAGKGRDVCVEIGPVVEHGVAQTKAAVKEGVRQTRTVVRNAEVALDAGINTFQQLIAEQINKARAAINKELLALIALGSDKAAFAIGKLSQDRVQAVLSLLMRMAKMIYVAQLAINWEKAGIHPLLLKKGTKSAVAGGVKLGKTQPRQPWQDVHVEIKGPSVDDVSRNFIERWNAAQMSYASDATLTDMGGLLGAVFGVAGVAAGAAAGGAVGSAFGARIRAALLIPAHLVPLPRPPQTNAAPKGVAVRILRSAPLKMCVQEARARGDKRMPMQAQSEIHTQMVHLIRNATDFIYIENQFFQTEFGKPSIEVFSNEGKRMTSGPMKYMIEQIGNRLTAEVTSAGFAPGKSLLPVNEIGTVLGERIAQSVRNGNPFHVYILLPVHPEGKLDDIAVVGQIHWTMQSLVFADHSLINRVRRAIAAKKICNTRLISGDAWEQALMVAGTRVGGKAPYENVHEMEWSKYLTLLNLRTCEEVDKVVRTEQIYIHSKLLIVDDRHVILGSANINDRSQSGKRDTELAVLLFDSEKVSKPIGEYTRTVNAVARKLRVDLWTKHFAMANGANDIVQAASEMKDFIERPAAAATISAIQRLASSNSEIYQDAFPHIPWSHTNKTTKEENGASIWPVCPIGINAKKAGESRHLMPFHEIFWSHTNSGIRAPEGIKGFFTKLPMNWTIGENNHPGNMSVMALTYKEKMEEPSPIGKTDLA
ncbi:MAG: phospholipase D-like domain-containing protein [Pseudomonadota bacterium]